MTPDQIERVALALVNRDMKKLDLPLLASVEEFRFADDREEYLDAARAAIAAAWEWRPIETAPRNRKVLAGYYDSLGKWQTILACYYSKGALMADDACDDGDEDGYAPEGWYEESETHEEHLRPPEHDLLFWMSLPTPPEDRHG